MSFDVSARTESGRVCRECGTPFSGDLENDEYIPFYCYCAACDRKTYFVTEEEYEQR